MKITGISDSITLSALLFSSSYLAATTLNELNKVMMQSEPNKSQKDTRQIYPSQLLNWTMFAFAITGWSCLLYQINNLLK
jgi:hypothetical protein